MQASKLSAAAALVALLASTSASAELQSWTLMASIWDQPFDGIPEAFSHGGQVVQFDFVFEMQPETVLAPTFLSARPLRSLSVNGLTTSAEANLTSTDDYQVLSAQPIPIRSDGVTAALFYTTSLGTQAESTLGAFNRFSAVIGDPSTGLVLQFNEGSIWMTPLSFQPAAIPEPSTVYLTALGMAFGLLAMGVNARES